MSVFEIIGAILMLLMSVSICLLVLMQEGTKGGGMAAFTGGDDSFMGRNQGRSRDELLFKATRFCAIIFFAATIIVHALNAYLR